MSGSVRVSEAELPSWDGVLPPWPGTERDGVFVRTAPGPATGGEPALLVHGLGGASTNWTDLMGLLAGHLHSEAMDLPGFGRSAPSPTGYRLGVHVRSVVRQLERTGPSHLFGNSLGGAVCTRVAALRPDLVRTLTLVSPALPALKLRRTSDPRLPLLLLPGVSGVVNRALAKRTPEQRAAAVLQLCYADASTIPPQRVEEAVAEVRRRLDLGHAEDAFTGSLRGLVGAYLERGTTSLWRQAARVTAPTLLVWGTQDRLVDVALAPRAGRAFRDSRLLVLPDTGHVAQLERPDVVARAFLGMLEDVSGRQGASAAS